MTQVHHNCNPAKLLAALLVLHRGFEQDGQAAKQSRIIAARSEDESTRHSAACNQQPKQQQQTLAKRPFHISRTAVAEATSAAPMPATLVATVVEVLDICPSTVVPDTRAH
jgi:hypothetical protein